MFLRGGRADFYDIEFEELTLEQDPTLISMLTQRLSERVSQLLSDSFISSDVSKDQLDRFRSQYLKFSFRCRFAPCTNASLGFESETARASHEQLHVRRLFCNKPNCARGRIGFRHQGDLKNHERTYHQQGSILVPPRVRKAFDSDTIASKHEAISYDGGLFSPNGNDHSASRPSTTQQDVVKYKTLIPFDVNRIGEALAKWKKSRSQPNSFALLQNEKLKSSLDVNLIHIFPHDSSVLCVKINPDDRFIATGCTKLARVFDIRTREEKYYFDINPHGYNMEMDIRSINFSSNRNYLLTGSEDGY